MKTRNDSSVGRLLRLAAMAILLAVAALPAAERPATDAARARIEALRADIRHHDDLYYKKSAPKITDAAYDQLKRELTSLEKDFPVAAAGASPSDSLGDDRSGAFPLYRHRERMQHELAQRHRTVRPEPVVGRGG